MHYLGSLKVWTVRGRQGLRIGARGKGESRAGGMPAAPSRPEAGKVARGPRDGAVGKGRGRQRDRDKKKKGTR